MEPQTSSAATTGTAVPQAADTVQAGATGGDEGLVATTAQAASPEAGMTEMIGAGGPVLMIIIVMSVVATAFILAKLWQFRHVSEGGARRTKRILGDAANREEAAKRLSGMKNPVARVAAFAISGVPQERAWREAEETIEPYRSHMRLLEVIAALAPLLGLLGTVLGMIDAFQALGAAQGRADPHILSNGIWEALLTTAAGLALAIPATAFVNWFDRRIERMTFHMETVLSRLFDNGSAMHLLEGDEHESRSLATPRAAE